MVKPRENPFRTSLIHALPFYFEDGSREEFFANLKRKKFRGALVGPHGSGKSTLLSECIEFCEERGFTTCHIRLKDGVPPGSEDLEKLNSITPGTVLFVDGVEQLGFFGWQKVKRSGKKAAGFIVTSHITGYLPTIYECFPSPALLARLMGELLDTGAADLVPLAVMLHRYHRGNLREAFFEMYDLWSRGTCLGEEAAGLNTRRVAVA